MDEPLGALDKKLREALQLEILRISRQVGATVIYVTHDQEEALAMSDRIAILNLGRVEQLGTGEDLYERPASVFVADFIGESNIFRGQYSRDGTGGVLVSGSSTWRIGSTAMSGRMLGDGAAALVLRPEHFRVEAADQPADPERNAADATVTEVLYLGATRKIQLVLGDGRPAVGREGAASGRAWQAGDEVRISWAPNDGVLVSDERQ
jgi:putative spermidine/putrescine transport system ATP-binding protein